MADEKHMTVRGLRGATTAESNTKPAIAQATRELLEALARENGFAPGDVAAAFFTATPDLDAGFPATTARVDIGWSTAALMDLQQMHVQGDVPRCIRALILLNTDKPPEELKPVYLRGAKNLRSRDAEAR